MVVPVEEEEGSTVVASRGAEYEDPEIEKEPMLAEEVVVALRVGYV
jgi:hypothetical protein